MIEDLLSRAGLSQREVRAYLTLLRHGELTAGEIAKITGFIRTNSYDVLNDLVRKGIVAYVVRNGRKYFHATDQEKISDYIESKKQDLDELKGEIATASITAAADRSERPTIEVYEGKEGMKTILAMSVRESIKTGKEIIGISVQQQKCRELAGNYHAHWYTDREKHKIKSRYIMSAEEPIIPVKYTKFKVLPESAKNPNEIFIFGDITSQFFFVKGVFSAIVIKNKEITEKYRDYFDFLWGVLK